MPSAGAAACARPPAPPALVPGIDTSDGHVHSFGDGCCVGSDVCGSQVSCLSLSHSRSPRIWNGGGGEIYWRPYWTIGMPRGIGLDTNVGA